MSKSIYLRTFEPHQLILSEEETRLVLQYFFQNTNKQKIANMTVTDSVRGFAQGLLVAAIDASYAMGFVESLFLSSSNPANGARKVIKKFAKSAVKKWFKHAKPADLLDAKIYNIVRGRLEANFKFKMHEYLDGIAKALEFSPYRVAINLLDLPLGFC